MLTSFVIANPQRCLGCFTCMAACSVGHQQQGLQACPRLQITYSQVGTMPVQCHQCEDAPCALVCPVRAIEIEDGMVRLNEVNCIGCKMCVLACPFGAITVDGTAPASGGRPWGAGRRQRITGRLGAPAVGLAGRPENRGRQVRPLLFRH